MKLLLLGGVLLGAGLLAWANRCRFGFHGDVLLTQKRAPDGRVVKPHVLAWECQRCHRTASETAVTVRWRQQADLRRQARLRKEAS